MRYILEVVKKDNRGAKAGKERFSILTQAGKLYLVGGT